MKIITKYNINDIVHFYPFGKKTLKLVSSTITNISIVSSSYNICITYTVNDTKGVSWDVRESSIVEETS